MTVRLEWNLVETLKVEPDQKSYEIKFCHLIGYLSTVVVFCAKMIGSVTYKMIRFNWELIWCKRWYGWKFHEQIPNEIQSEMWKSRWWVGVQKYVKWTWDLIEWCGLERKYMFYKTVCFIITSIVCTTLRLPIRLPPTKLLAERAGDPSCEMWIYDPDISRWGDTSTFGLFKTYL